MNKVITDGLALMPPAFASGLSVWSRTDGTAGSPSYAGFGDVALVRATNKYVRVIDGNAVTGMTAYTDTYIHEGGRWLCIQAQLTAVAMEHWPGDDTIIDTWLRGVLQPQPPSVAQT